MLRVKPGYTCKKPGIPEKYLGPRQCRARPTPRAPAPTAARTACSSTRTAPAKRCRWRFAGGGADDAVLDAVVPTSRVSSATLARGLHRRVDPLAERQGALAAHAAGVVRLEAGLAAEVLAFFWHPHHIARHPRVHRQFALLAAVCRCILVLEDQLACSTSARLVVAVHRAAASLSTAQRARGRVVA